MICDWCHQEIGTYQEIVTVTYEGDPDNPLRFHGDPCFKRFMPGDVRSFAKVQRNPLQAP